MVFFLNNTIYFTVSKVLNGGLFENLFWDIRHCKTCFCEIFPFSPVWPWMLMSTARQSNSRKKEKKYSRKTLKEEESSGGKIASFSFHSFPLLSFILDAAFGQKTWCDEDDRGKKERIGEREPPFVSTRLFKAKPLLSIPAKKESSLQRHFLLCGETEWGGGYLVGERR